MNALVEKSLPRYKARSGYVVREIAGEYLLIPVKMQEGEGSQIAVLNDTGKFLWEQLVVERTEEELIKTVTEEYRVTEEEAQVDIREFLQKLKKSNLL